jgi:hypothetical protein
MSEGGILSGFNISSTIVSQGSAAQTTDLCYKSPTIWTSIGGNNYAQQNT